MNRCAGLLSCSDIEELLSRFLPRRDVNEEEVMRQMGYRYRKRRAAIESHQRIAGRRESRDYRIV